MARLTLSFCFILTLGSIKSTQHPQSCDNVPRGTFTNLGATTSQAEPGQLRMDLDLGNVISGYHYSCMLLTDASHLLKEWKQLHGDGYDMADDHVLKAIQASLSNILLTEITTCEQRARIIKRYVSLWDTRQEANLTKRALFQRPNNNTTRLGRSLPDKPYFSSIPELRRIISHLKSNPQVDTNCNINTLPPFQPPEDTTPKNSTDLKVSMTASVFKGTLRQRQDNIQRTMAMASMYAATHLLEDHLNNLTNYLDEQNRRPKRWVGMAAKVVRTLISRTFPAVFRFGIKSSGKRLVKTALKVAVRDDIKSPFQSHLAWLQLASFRLNSKAYEGKKIRATYSRHLFYSIKIAEAISLSTSAHASFEPILRGLASLRQNKLHPLLLNQEDLETALKDLYHTALLEDRTPLMEDPTSLFSAPVESTYNINTMKLTLTIFVPMARSGTTSTLYLWNPLPLSSGSISLRARPQHQLLAVRTDDRSSYSLDSNQLALCRYDRNSNTRYCPNFNIKLDQAQDRCLQGLYRSNVNMVKAYCRFVHNTDVVSAIQISDTQFTVFSHTEMPGRIICPNVQDLPLSIQGHHNIDLEENCRFLSEPLKLSSAAGKVGYQENSSPRKLCQIQKMLQSYKEDFQILIDVKVAEFGPAGNGLLLEEVEVLANDIRQHTGLRITAYILATSVLLLLLLSGTLSLGLKSLLRQAWNLHSIASHTYAVASSTLANPSRRNSDTSDFRPDYLYPNLSPKTSPKTRPRSRRSQFIKSTPDLLTLARSLSRSSLAPRTREEKLKEIKSILTNPEQIPLTEKGVKFEDSERD